MRVKNDDCSEFLLVVYESNVTDEGCFEAIIFTTYTRYYNVYESDEWEVN